MANTANERAAPDLLFQQHPARVRRPEKLKPGIREDQSESSAALLKHSVYTIIRLAVLYFQNEHFKLEDVRIRDAELPQGTGKF